MSILFYCIHYYEEWTARTEMYYGLLKIGDVIMLVLIAVLVIQYILNKRADAAEARENRARVNRNARAFEVSRISETVPPASSAERVIDYTKYLGTTEFYNPYKKGSTLWRMWEEAAGNIKYHGEQ